MFRLTSLKGVITGVGKIIFVDPKEKLKKWALSKLKVE